MFGTVLAANAFGLRVSSGFQLVLASVLVVVIASAIAIALPSRGGDNWHPFAPHGWWAVGTAANILDLALHRLGGGRAARRRVPPTRSATCRARWRSRSASSTILYCGLAAATIARDVRQRTPGCRSRISISVGFGRAGRDATAVLAVALTMGTMNVYIGGSSKLSPSLGPKARCRVARRATRTAASRAGRWC